MHNTTNILIFAMDMKQLVLYILFLMTMVFGGHGEVSAAVECAQHSTDKLQKVEHKQENPVAQLEDASTAAYRVCNSRSERLAPTGNIHANPSASRLLFNKIRFLSSLLSATFGGWETFRQESAPIHFDVASKYYVICLRHLRC